MVRRDPNTFFFALGWFLVALNFALMAWAVYVPIGFNSYQQDILFSLDTAQGYVKLNTFSVVATLGFAVLQIFVIGKFAKRMFSDTYATAAAEAALKIARATAVILAVVCVGSIIVDILFYRRWVDAYIQFA
ncbi:MAG: hypothetical protein ABIV13_06330 [Fimbriimonadales bacterium]